MNFPSRRSRYRANTNERSDDDLPPVYPIFRAQLIPGTSLLSGTRSLISLFATPAEIRRGARGHSRREERTAKIGTVLISKSSHRSLEKGKQKNGTKVALIRYTGSLGDDSSCNKTEYNNINIIIYNIFTAYTDTM